MSEELKPLRFLVAEWRKQGNVERDADVWKCAAELEAQIDLWEARLQEDQSDTRISLIIGRTFMRRRLLGVKE